MSRRLLTALHRSCFDSGAAQTTAAQESETMYRETLQEDLLAELSRLVGRPLSVVQDGLARLLECVESRFDADLLAALGPFPMTSWASLAADSAETGALWCATAAAGLTAEEGLTALAVVDDHVRRRYGNEAWSRVRDWGPQMAGRYELAPVMSAPSYRRATQEP
jgi:hypothetical protein